MMKRLIPSALTSHWCQSITWVMTHGDMKEKRILALISAYLFRSYTSVMEEIVDDVALCWWIWVLLMWMTTEISWQKVLTFVNRVKSEFYHVNSQSASHLVLSYFYLSVDRQKDKKRRNERQKNFAIDHFSTYKSWSYLYYSNLSCEYSIEKERIRSKIDQGSKEYLVMNTGSLSNDFSFSPFLLYLLTNTIDIHVQHDFE